MTAACLWPSLIEAPRKAPTRSHVFTFLTQCVLPRDRKMCLYLLSPGGPRPWACDNLAITTGKLQARHLSKAVKIFRWGLYNIEVGKLPNPCSLGYFNGLADPQPAIFEEVENGPKPGQLGFQRGCLWWKVGLVREKGSRGTKMQRAGLKPHRSCVKAVHQEALGRSGSTTLGPVDTT